MPFDPEKQRIYPYYDGTLDATGKYQIRRGDPLVIYRRIIDAIGGEEALAALWDKAHSPHSPTVYQDRAILADVVRRSFEIQPVGYGPGGLTEDSIIEVLYDFAVWQKKSESVGDGSLSSSPLIPDLASPSST